MTFFTNLYEIFDAALENAMTQTHDIPKITQEYFKEFSKLFCNVVLQDNFAKILYEKYMLIGRKVYNEALYWHEIKKPLLNILL